MLNKYYTKYKLYLQVGTRLIRGIIHPKFKNFLFKSKKYSAIAILPKKEFFPKVFLWSINSFFLFRFFFTHFPFFIQVVLLDIGSNIAFFSLKLIIQKRFKESAAGLYPSKHLPIDSSPAKA